MRSSQLCPGFVVAFALALTFASLASATGIPPDFEHTPSITLEVDGVRWDVPLQYDPNDAAGGGVDGWQLQTSEFSVTITAYLEPDPEIVYAGSVVDFGAPSTFGFLFQENIVPTAAPGSVSHQHSSSTTDGNPPSGTPVTAGAFAVPVDSDGMNEIAVYTLSLNGGASFVSADHDLSPSFVGASPGDTQGSFFESGPGPAGAGNYDVMRVDVNFAMNGASDAYSFNGRVTVIPEPRPLLLLGAALAGLALVRRRPA